MFIFIIYPTKMHTAKVHEPGKKNVVLFKENSLFFKHYVAKKMNSKRIYTKNIIRLGKFCTFSKNVKKKFPFFENFL